MNSTTVRGGVVPLLLLILAGTAPAQQAPNDSVSQAKAILKSAEEAAAKAAADAANIEKAAAESEKAALAAEKAALEKAAADKAAALKAVAGKAAAARKAAANAETQILHARAALAYTVARKAAEEKAQAQKALQEKTQALNAAATKAAQEKSAAEKLAAEAAAAKTALDACAPDQKELATKTCAEKAAAAQAASEKSLAAAGACEKAAAARAEAEQALLQKTAAHVAAIDQASATKAASLGGLKPLAREAWDYAKARHLLWRAGFGGTPEEVSKLHALGLHEAVRQLVYFSAVEAPESLFEAWPRETTIPHLPYESKFTNDEQLKIETARQQVEGRQVGQFRAWWLRRMVESPRPLQEKLVLFWHGHFACQYSILDQQSYLMYRQNQLFRQHAAGHFDALLRGLVHDTTMIRYLNNDANTKGKPNENLAREIMELFSMGIGNYTEEDIREASRALTGYTCDRSSGEFRFIKANHDEGVKSIWGRSGNFSGDDLVDLILQQPATARFIARKLFAAFAHDAPDEATVDRLASVLRESRHNIAVMLENLFLSETFYDARSMGTQIKSPVQLVVGTLRALGAKDAPYRSLADGVRNMGQDLLEPPNVKGWEGGRTWIDANRIFHRYNAVADLVETSARPNNTRGVDMIGEVLAGRSFKDAAELVDHLAKAFLLVPLSPAKRQALLDYACKLPPCGEWAAKKAQVNPKLAALLVMITSSPEYQLD